MTAVFRLVVASENRLYLLEQFRADERRVGPVVQFVFPDELPFVERVLQQPFEVSLGEKLAELRLEDVSHICKGVPARSV